jgi:sporulation protein YqfD
MFIEKIIDYIIGKAVFEITLRDKKEAAVLNLLKKRGFYDCRVVGEKIKLSCSCADSGVIKDMLTEMNVKHTLKTVGIFYTIDSLKYRLGIVFACALCIALHMFFSGIVWKIDIVGNEVVREDEIRTTLRSMGIYEGCSKKKINVPKLTMEYMLKDDRFSFVHLNMNGTTGILKVSERTKDKKTPDKKEVSNIVARCDGIITRLDVYSGGREVENGETVLKGQLLISSFFETRLSGYLLRRAKGVAFAKTSPVFEMHIPKEYEKEGKISKKYEKNRLSVLDFSFVLDGANTVLDEGIISFEKDEKKLSLFGIIPTPAYIKSEKYILSETETAKRTKDEAKSMFDNAFEEWKDGFQKDCEILSEDFSFEETQDEYIFFAKLSCIENIGVDKPFKIGEN